LFGEHRKTMFAAESRTARAVASAVREYADPRSAVTYRVPVPLASSGYME
jgi:hypothetical protein